MQIFSPLPGRILLSFCFFFNDTATTEIYTLSLHDALPISVQQVRRRDSRPRCAWSWRQDRSEEHTSELQSRLHLVCRLLLEKNKKTRTYCTLESPRPLHIAVMTTIIQL